MMHSAWKDIKLLFKNKISFVFVLCVTCLCLLGVVMQYSAGGGNFYKFAYPHTLRILLGIGVFMFFYLININILYKLSEYIHGFSFLLLVMVEFFGQNNMGAQRWLDLGIVSLQPSEFLKLSSILILAKYFHMNKNSQDILFYIKAAAFVVIPVIFVLMQPDLGTSILVLVSSGSLIFVNGIRRKYILFTMLASIVLAPIAWINIHDYQKERILSFVNPSKDLLGSGYHTNQSKIAVGSGGLFGKGYLQGTQTQLQFLPEQQTDFIITVFNEEFGFVGSLILISLIMVMLSLIMLICISCKTIYSKHISVGIGVIFFLYVFINLGVIVGILPVVGVPFPLVSYGGSAIVANMLSFGLLMNINTKKQSIIS